MYNPDMNNITIKFRFKDDYTHGKWQVRIAHCRSVKQMIDIYGLDMPDVEYEILEIDGKKP